MERTDQPTRQPTPTGPRTVRHANGLEFRVIPADSYDARIARDVRPLTMADGTVWTVGAPVGWHGTPAAWQTPTPTAQAARKTARHEYGESMARRDRRQLGLHISSAVTA
jgi:hypothetical protein